MVAKATSTSYHEESRVPCCPHLPSLTWQPTPEPCCVTTTFQYLHTSGWYWGSISASEACDALLSRSEGTFLVRDSSHPDYMLTLSVKTRCGPTNVRIKHDASGGCFWLDCGSPPPPHPRTFPDVLSLIQHYVSFGQSPRGRGGDEGGDLKAGPEGYPVQQVAKACGVRLRLVRPLHRPHAFPSLQHMARLAIHRSTDSSKQLPLPKLLLGYLKDYPFHV